MAEAQREAWITGIGIVSSLGEGPEAHWQELMEGRRQRRRDDARALRRASARAAQSRQADPEEGRPAPDGGVAAHRHLCGRPRARLRRRQGQCRDPRAHGHDRRRRRRRARRRRRHHHPVRHAARVKPGRLPQRAADERSAADAVSGAALQPAGRQHLDRARRHRLLAHLHGRGSRRRRRGAHRAVAHRRRPERHRAGRRRAQCRAARDADALRVRPLRPEGPLCAGLGARRKSPASRSVRSAPSW